MIYRLAQQALPFDKHIGFYGLQPNDLKMSLQKINFELFFIEMSASSQKQYGIKLDGQFASQLLPKYQDLTSFNAILTNDVNSGKSRIIQKAQILCQVNSKCQLQEGGEIPVKSHTIYSHAIDWKNYGLTIELKPELEINSSINVLLDYNLSFPDYSEAVDNVPSFKTKKFKNQFIIQPDKVVLISGLQLDLLGESKSSPWLTHKVPLLKYLFENRSDKKSSTNLLLFIKASARNDQ